MKVLYFAWLRQHVGLAEETIDAPATVVTVGDLIGWLRERSPGHHAAFANEASIRIAIDQNFADPSDPIADAAEVAFFPPVTGG